jgi:hypothetical protein
VPNRLVQQVGETDAASVLARGGTTGKEWMLRSGGNIGATSTAPSCYGGAGMVVEYAVPVTPGDTLGIVIGDGGAGGPAAGGAGGAGAKGYVEVYWVN